MKNRWFPFLTLLSAPLLLAGCFAPAEEADEVLDSETQLEVITRAAEGDVAYPLLILAYDEEGKLKGEQSLKSESEKIKLSLAEGVYHITALSGLSAYKEPSSYDKSSAVVTIPTAGYADAPLMLGGADVMLAGTSATVNVVMTYQVASVELSLAEVPADVTEVTVGVSQQYGALNMQGIYSKNSTATIKCKKVGAEWLSDKVYLMPGAGTTTTLTLSLTRPSGQSSYSYVLSEALAAAVPYTIKGRYVASAVPTITGVITMQGWQDQRTIDFDFGGSGSGGGEVPDIGVSDLPVAGSEWEGHVVALVDNATSESADLLLISLEEYTNVYSPSASGHETQMAELADAYSEGELEGWSVPTEEEARQLKSVYAGAFDDLNGVIEELNGVLITVTTTNNNSRYLCENGTKTFNFATNGSINKAGATVKYRLRLVKKVHVTATR